MPNGQGQAGSRSRWIRYSALALLAVVACVLLANWQNHRREDRDAQIAVIKDHYSGAPVPLAQVLPQRTEALDGQAEWTKVDVRGHYDTAHTVLARNRSQDGQPGFYVVVPFVLESGAQIAVVRGWTPVPNDSPQPALSDLPAPPSGTITVTGWLRPTQDGSKDNNPSGSIKAIDPRQIPGMDAAYTGAYVELQAENGAAATGISALPEPSTDPGSHLSYTFQWLAFGVMIIIAVVIGLRRERRAEAEARLLAADRRAEAQPQFVVVDKEALASGAKIDAIASRYGHGNDVAYRPRSAPARPKNEDEEDSALDEQGL